MLHARFRGLLKLAGGLVVAVPAALITLGLGRLIGQYVVSALVGFPLAISMIGFMEIVIGTHFADLALRFDRGNFFIKTGIAVMILSFAALYVLCGVMIYRAYFE